MSPKWPPRSGVRSETMVAPYVMARTSTPWAFVMVNSSTGLPSAVVPNAVRVMRVRING